MEKLLSQKNVEPRWYERFPRALPVGIFALTMTVTGLSVFAIEYAETQREVAQLAQTAQMVTSGLDRRASENVAYLRSAAALFATQRAVEAPLFQTFIGQLHLEGNFAAGTRGIGWAMRIPTQELGVVEDVMRRSGIPQFTVRPRPAPSQAYAVPVVYIQPKIGRNQEALGFDLMSDPIRRNAMLSAERLGQPVASAPTTLLSGRELNGPRGFVVMMPVFTLTRQGAQRALRGFVYSPFDAQKFLESSLERNLHSTVGVRIYDTTARPENLLAELRLADGSGRMVRREIDLAGRPWILEVEAAASPMLSITSVLTLMFGLLVATLLLVLARLLTQQAVEDRIALAWFEQQSSIRNSLTRELNHRVKNTLANVLSIIALTRRRASSLDSFADSLEGRIRALSATHDLLTQSEWGTTPVRLVIEAEMAPYAHDADRHLELSGPEVELAPNDALSLGLAIHELATNAAKYGALSVHDGSVTVTWERAGDNLARIEWIERGGPPVEMSGKRKRGFGTDLIEKIVAHELRHPVDLRFEPDGVRCTLLIPVRRRGDFAIRERRR